MAGFEEADAAIAASGTVILELALAYVPVVSTYKGDWIIRMLANRIKVWTGALPNLIADYAVVPEYFNDVLRPASLVRWAERLSTGTPQRQAMLAGYDDVWSRLQTALPAGDAGAELVLALSASARPALSLCPTNEGVGQAFPSRWREAGRGHEARIQIRHDLLLVHRIGADKDDFLTPVAPFWIEIRRHRIQESRIVGPT